jgi:exodeoxyribonuclease III
MKKIISWNVNGLRAIIKKGFVDFLVSEKPDILALQEVKAEDKHISKSDFLELGYELNLFSAKKPGYSGVAVFVKKGQDYDLVKGLGLKEFDDEGRSIELAFNDFVFVNAYFPNSQAEGRRLDYKIAFCDAMKSHLDKLNKKGKHILLCGDYNIAHKEIDLTNPKANENSPGFLPEERAWMDKFLAKDYIDTFRIFTPEAGHYTWWSYRTNARSRNVGWRIDYHCVNKLMQSRIKKSYHNNDVMGSDHCPVTVIVD